MRARGQALVEFALILVIFLSLMLGMVDWGLYLYANTVIDSAARDGARTAVTYNDWASNGTNRTNQIRTLIIDRTQILPLNIRSGIGGHLAITFTPNNTSPESITVEIRQQPFKPISGFLGPLVPHVISARTTMRYEGR